MTTRPNSLLRPNRVPNQFSQYAGLPINVVSFKDAGAAGLTHSGKRFGRRVETGTHGGNEGLQIAGRHEPTISTRTHQFRNPSDVSRNDRPPQSHRFHEDHRESFGEAR